MNKNKPDVPGMDRLARHIITLKKAPLSPQAERKTRLCLLDTLGAGAYGATTREAADIVQSVRTVFGRGPVPVWGTRLRLSAAGAAFCCGGLAHVRELDDVHYAILHTGCVCIPAAMAVVGMARELPVSALLTSVVCGVEAMVRVAQSMDFLAHRERGWHGTATCGAFGAAATAGVLLGLNERQLADAFGLAGSRTGGTWAFSVDGTMSKRIHPGFAAMDGLLAAYLAKGGVTGPHYVLEAEDGGIFRTFGCEGTTLEALDAPTQRLAIEDVEFKWFASCKSVHSPLCAAQEIYRNRGSHIAENVERITVEVNSSALSMAGRMYNESSVVSAQLSIPYGVALGLQGRMGQAVDYEPLALQDSLTKRIAQRTEVYHTQEFDELRRDEHKSGARVTVYWNDGTKESAIVTQPRGSAGNPLSEEHVLDKFMQLGTFALGARRSELLRDFLLEIDTTKPAFELYHHLLPRSIRSPRGKEDDFIDN